MGKEALKQFNLENATFTESNVESESKKIIEVLINSEIESSDELARRAILNADDIINNEFSTEEEKELAKQSKNKIISLGFYLKNYLGNLIRLGLLGGFLFINPISLLTSHEDSGSKNPIVEEGYKCITGKDKDVNPDYGEERAYLNATYLQCFDNSEIEVIRSGGEEEKQGLLKMISSPEYLSKLIIEYGSIEKASREQSNREYLVKNSDFTVKGFIVNEGRNATGLFVKSEANKCFGIYISEANAVPEEYTHLLSCSGLPENTQNIINESFVCNEKQQSKLAKIYGNDKVDFREYFGNPDERYAKLHVLKLRLDESGLKKYGENFTREHYDKLVELVNRYNNGEGVELDIDSIILLETTKGFGSDDGFNYLERMFNEIAMNGSDINSNLA